MIHRHDNNYNKLSLSYNTKHFNNNPIKINNKLYTKSKHINKYKTNNKKSSNKKTINRYQSTYNKDCVIDSNNDHEFIKFFKKKILDNN